MPASPNLYVYHQREIIPVENAFLHISDLAVQRGYGIFDFFKVRNGVPLFLNDYLRRFYESARLMHLPVPLAADELKNVLHQLMAKNQLPESGVKMILTGGYSADGYQPAAPNLIITQHPLLPPPVAQVEQGLRVITHAYGREWPAAKSIHYATGIRLLPQIRAAGADDVLYQQHGVVTECPRSNFFLVTADERVRTPAQDVLRGITRQNVLTLARKKYSVEEGVVTLADIAQAQEAFTTSTSRRILPIVQVDGRPVGNGQPGPITRALLQDLLALEKAAVGTADLAD